MRTIPRPATAVGVEVPEGQSLFLLASPLSDTFVGMGSRTAAAVLLAADALTSESPDIRPFCCLSGVATLPNRQQGLISGDSCARHAPLVSHPSLT